MRKINTGNCRKFSNAASAKNNTALSLTYAEWNAMVESTLTCTEPSDEMLAEFAYPKKGTVYIRAQALREQNPVFFDRLSLLVVRDVVFKDRLIDKIRNIESDDGKMAFKKSSLKKPFGQISLAALCDPEQYAMRGRFHEMVKLFSTAMEFSGDSLSDMDKDQIRSFLAAAHEISRPSEVFRQPAPLAIRERVPA